MFATERQAKIYEMICKNDAVSTSNLVKKFGVSIETIRRDLLEMEKQNQLKRVHGGAIRIGDMKPFVELQQRHRNKEEEKTALANIAVTMVKEGDFIAVDSGSTAMFFAEALKKNFESLTIVTHSLDVFQILRDHKNFDILLCAGHYMKNENAFYGMLTIEMLDKIHVEKSFICPSSVALEHGVCDYHPDLCMVQKKLIDIADSVHILADNSKFEKRALMKLCDMKPEYKYISDGGLNEELKTLYRESGIKIITEN